MSMTPAVSRLILALLVNRSSTSSSVIAVTYARALSKVLEAASGAGESTSIAPLMAVEELDRDMLPEAPIKPPVL